MSANRLRIFSNRFVDDPGAMSTAIRAIDELSWHDAFSNYDFLQTLPQSEATLPWLIEKMNAVGGSRAALAHHVQAVLRRCIIGADTAVLTRRLTEVMALRVLNQDDREVILERIEIASLSADELWLRLESICKSQSDPNGLAASARRRARLLLEGLRGHPGSCSQRIFRILCGRAISYWPLEMAVKLAGDIRLESSVPRLLEIFHQGQCEEECEQALASIGTNELVDALAKLFPHEEFFLGRIVLVLGKIYTEHAVSTRIHLAENSSDQSLQSLLLGSALEQFAPPALEPARQFVLRFDLNEHVEYVRSALVRASKMLNHRFPEFDARRDEEVPDEVYGRRCLQPSRQVDLGMVA